MEGLVREIRTLLHSITQRLAALIAETPTRTLQVTGVLGLAAVLYGLYQLQSQARPKRDSRDNSRGRSSRNSEASTSGAQQRPATQARTIASTSKAAPSSAANRVARRGGESQLAWAVRSRLAGVRVIVISAPGVLLEEWTLADLQESATLRPEAADILREIARNCAVFLVTQVEDDTGEATCRGALEAGGLVGSKPGQIPAQRLLFCSTLDGKVSIVRQLEPQLHIDAHPKTVEDLKRFIKMVHICPPGKQAAGVGSPNVGVARSLAHLFEDQAAVHAR